MLNFIKDFKCPHCISLINIPNDHPIIDSIQDLHCSCKNTQITTYIDSNNYQLYCNLLGSWQIQIHLQPSILDAHFTVIEYPPKDVIMDFKKAILLNLSFIPNNLNWNDIRHLHKQLEILITFQ